MQEKWYKQFWPWFLITIPAISFMLGGMMLYLATSGQDTLVSDDYYKEGKAINVDLGKIEQARTLGLAADLRAFENKVVLTFTKNSPPDNSAIKLSFFHTTIAEQDFSIMLIKSPKGEYVGELPKDASGRWRITVSAFDESWKMQRKIALPNSSSIQITP